MELFMLAFLPGDTPPVTFDEVPQFETCDPRKKCVFSESECLDRADDKNLIEADGKFYVCRLLDPGPWRKKA